MTFLVSNNFPIEIRNCLGLTPLMSAVSEGSVEVVKLFLDAGSDPRAIDSKGNTMMMLTAYRLEKGSIRTILDLLLNAGANPLAKDKDGSSCLHYACDVTMAEFALAHGADFNGRNERGETPLIYWCKDESRYAERASVSNYILRQGADPNLQDKGGRTALCYARDWQSGEDIVRLLQKLGANEQIRSDIDILRLWM